MSGRFKTINRWRAFIEKYRICCVNVLRQFQSERKYNRNDC
ncbi:hypothetical protein DDI_3889 [Dickeya dianthicola RNS04.9]|nr:hypothetical protein DDI_3889 [Dickeya dianthicola RNS04.9]